MTIRPALVFVTLVTASALAAQSSFTSPAGVAGIEGTERFLMFGNRHLQGLDNTVPGPVPNISSIGFRRDGTNTNSNGDPRTMDVLLVMGTGNFAARTSAFAGNFTSSTVAIATRTVNFPDWRQPPASPPAPFDFVLPFDQPWSYTGAGALIWDITVSNISAGGNAPMDRHGWSSTLGVNGDNLGTGCVATGETSEFSHSFQIYNEGPGGDMRLRWSGFNAPASAPTVITFDATDANATIPGLCTTVHAPGALGNALTPLPSSSGTINSTSTSFPYAPIVVGAQLVTQLVSLDAGQPGIPVVLSNGELSTMPPYLDVAYIWDSDITDPTGVLISPGTIPVTQFTY